jgi:DNA-binding cell septation regulator SpoVG
MLSIDLILIPVLEGFLFVKYCYLTRFRAIRDNGYIILFKSAVCGFFFYGIALFFWRASILDTSANPKISEFLASLNRFLINRDLVPVLLSLILTVITILALNYVLDEDEMKKRVVRQDDDALEVTILKVYEEEKYLLVSLNNGKVYVGKVTDTYFRINDEIRSVLINPLSSGFRDNKDFKVKLNTYYGKIYEQIIENPGQFDVKISDFSVAIRYDNIITVSPFDPQIYAKFRELDGDEDSLV